MEECKDCDKKCTDHAVNTSRISVLEDKYSVVVENTSTVSKLSSKVSLLLVFMTMVVIIVSGGALYTFTGINTFKDTYFEDRITLNKELTIMNIENRDLIIDSIDDLEDSMYHKIEKLDDRIDVIDKTVSKMSTKIESFHREN